MKLKSLEICALLALFSAFMSSCGTTGDVVNPTISEMDKLDTQWGLPPRQPRGVSPRKNSAPQELLNTAPAYTPAPAPSAPAAPSPSVQQPSSGVDPSVIQTLR